MKKVFELDFRGRKLVIETGELAKQASGAVLVRYGDTDIQFPSIHKDVNTVFVNYEGGKYFIVDKDYKPSVVEEKTTQKKGYIKKTTGNKVQKLQ